MGSSSSLPFRTESRPLRVLAWVTYAYDVSPGQRFRIEQWEPLLRREGIQITYASFGGEAMTSLLGRPGSWSRKASAVVKALARRVIEALRVKGYDLVYVFREGALVGPAVAERILAARGLPFVYDFDDAVWLRYVSPVNSFFSYLRFPGKTRTLCRLAAHVTVGNSYLAEYAARHSPRVTIVPTTIDVTRHRPTERMTGRPPVIGWTGSFSTAQYLAMVRPVLERLAQRHDFTFVVVGAQGFEARGVRVEHRPWRSATEIEDLADFDIGIMPLPDAAWERGKCGLKALQYMALGLPAVVSPVGVNSQIVAHGENGFLASSDEEWEQALSRLVESPELRVSMGGNGRRCVEERYSAQVHAPRLANVFRSVAGGQ